MKILRAMSIILLLTMLVSCSVPPVYSPPEIQEEQ